MAEDFSVEPQLTQDAAPESMDFEQPTEPTPSPSSLRDSLAQRGLDVDGFESDDDIVNAFADAWPQFQTLPEKEKELQALRTAQARYLAQQYEEPEPEPEPQAEEQPFWNPPPIDETYANLPLEVDERTGLYRAPADRPELIEVAKRMNQRTLYEKQRFQEFRTNPQQFISQAVQPTLAELKQQILDDLKAEQQQVVYQQETNNLVMQYQKDLLAYDEGGNPVIDPATGDQALSEAGHAFRYFVDQNKQQFPGAPTNVIANNALRDLQLYRVQNGQPLLGQDTGSISAPEPVKPQAEPVPEPSPEFVNESLKDNFTNRLAGASRMADRGKEQFAGEEVQTADNTKLDFGQLLEAELKRNGGLN